MGLKNFRDEQGHAWRVWHVIMPAARAHLMDAAFRNGWLVFEREDGAERRRLGEVPDDWGSFPSSSLSALCERATPVAAGSLTGQQPAYRSPVQDDRRS